MSIALVELEIPTTTPLDEKTIGHISKFAATSIRRQLNVIACERSAHISERMGDLGVFCSRCKTHIGD